MRWIPLLLLLLVSACASEPEPAPPADDDPIDTPAALIAAMHDRYDGAWYETLTFVQETIQYRTGGEVDTSTWYEAYAAPGRLRIDFAPVEDGNGLLFASDSQYVFRDGSLSDARPRIHSLLLLGFDVYHLAPQETLQQLDTLGFDLSKMHTAAWQGRPVYVVGAVDPDDAAPQFWIDKEHLYFVRQVRPMGPDGGSIQEIQFNAYERAGGGWVAPEVLFLIDGEEALVERYTSIRPGAALDDAFFDPVRWRTAPRPAFTDPAP